MAKRTPTKMRQDVISRRNFTWVKLPYDAQCVECGKSVQAGTKVRPFAHYSADEHDDRVVCADCVPKLDAGERNSWAV
jgi:DNA-directed RNA polymerase subunit RPC12/RpoP